MIPNQERLLVGSAAGWQSPIMGTNVSVSGTLTKNDLSGNGQNTSGTAIKLQGATLLAGTYYYYLPVGGCQALDVTLNLASGTAPTITLYAVLSDSVTLKGTATSVTTLVAGTQTTTAATPRGERGWILKVVCTATNVFTTADYSAI